MAEYGLILALVGTVAIGGLQMLGTSIQTQYNGLGGTISQVSSGSSSLAVAGPTFSPGSPSGPSTVNLTTILPSSAATNGTTPTNATSTAATAQGGCSGNGCGVSSATGW